MMTNRELLDMYSNIVEEEGVKASKLKRIYNDIVRGDYTNIMSEMAEKYDTSILEWKIYRAISIRVIDGTLKMEGLGVKS